MKIINLVAIMLLLFSVGAAQVKKPRLDAGKLLTQAEAEAILGAPMKRAPETTGPHTALMIQYLEDSERLMTESISVQIHSGSVAGFTRYVKSMKTDLGLDPKPVEGFGAHAVYAEGHLVILQGRQVCVVMFFSNRPDEERLKVLKAVAEKFLPRLSKI